MEVKKSKSSASLGVVLYTVFLGIAIINMSYAIYDRHQRNKEAKNKSGKGAEIAKN